MADRRLSLPEDADAVERLARTLSQSVNARVLAVLMERRREDAAAREGREAGAAEGGPPRQAPGAEAGPGAAAAGEAPDEPPRPDGPGWMYLSEVADAVGEAPGTVGSSLQKLLPLLEEQRVKGRRFFRSRVVRLEIHVEEVD